MKVLTSLALVGCCIAPYNAWSQTSPGDLTYYVIEHQRSSESSDGSSSNSSGTDILLETFRGLEGGERRFTYDLPRDESGKTRSNFWYFPVDVIEDTLGNRRLANRQILEARISEWLAKYNIPRSLCGKYSNGNGFPYRIDCDPEVVLEVIDGYVLRDPDVAVGAAYDHPMGEGQGEWKMGTVPGILSAKMPVSAAKLREERVENQRVLAEMLEQPFDRDAVVAEMGAIQFSGEIEVTVEFDDVGAIARRTEHLRYQAVNPDGVREKVSSSVETAAIRD